MKKKILIVLACAVISLTLLGGSVFAYKSGHQTKKKLSETSKSNQTTPEAVVYPDTTGKVVIEPTTPVQTQQQATSSTSTKQQTATSTPTNATQATVVPAPVASPVTIVSYANTRTADTNNGATTTYYCDIKYSDGSTSSPAYMTVRNSQGGTIIYQIVCNNSLLGQLK